MATLSSKRRRRMPKRTFAIPGKRKYPVHDIAHARAAIQRVRQHGSPAEKRRVFAAIRRRYPALARRSTVIPTRTGTGLRTRRRRRR
jgi:hypothetical protein